MSKKNENIEKAIEILVQEYSSFYNPNSHLKSWFENTLKEGIGKKEIKYFNTEAFRKWGRTKMKEYYNREIVEMELIRKLEEASIFESKQLPDWFKSGIFTIIGAVISGPLSYWGATKTCFVFSLFFFV